MNIYAKEGNKVIVTEESAKNGYDSDTEKVKKYLQINGVYTVEKVEIHNWHTDVYLKEVPNIYFNSVNFVDFPYTSVTIDDKIYLLAVDDPDDGLCHGCAFELSGKKCKMAGMNCIIEHGHWILKPQEDE